MAIECYVIQWNDDNTAFFPVNASYNVDSLPVQGMTNPKQEVLVKRTEINPLDYDSRLVKKITFTGVSEDYDSEYPTNRKWVTTTTFEPKTIAEKIVSVEQEESTANYAILPNGEQLKAIVEALGLIISSQLGTNLDEEQELILANFAKIAVPMWDNKKIAEAKKALLEAGEEVDLDSDWKKDKDE